MSWTALVPLKAAAARKTRLAASLSSEARLDLSEILFRHLIEVLARRPEIGRVVLLSEDRPVDWAGLWISDQGRGLNAEIEAAARALGGKRLLVIHADLPAISAAGETVAIAPDRHGAGTNAIALTDASGFPFAFGPESFKRHREAAPKARIVERPGLGLDIDTPADLAAAMALEGLDQQVVSALKEGAPRS